MVCIKSVFVYVCMNTPIISRGEMKRISNTKCHMETCYCIVKKGFKCSQYIIVETMCQIDITCYQINPPVPRVYCIFLSHWPKLSHKSKLLQSIPNAIAFPPYLTVDKTLLLETSHTYVIRHGEIKLLLN